MRDQARVERLGKLFEGFTRAIEELRKEPLSHWSYSERTFPPTVEQTLRFFIDVMLTRARAVYVLLLNECTWEAEIVLRSFEEAQARCVLFAVTRDDSNLLEEFWVRAAASSDRKTAIKAEYAGAIQRTQTSREVFAFIRDKKSFAVEPQENKQARRQLEHQWSYPEVLKRIEAASIDGIALRDLKSMLHIYGMQSEVMHVSAKLYDLLWDRAIRGDDLAALEDGHIARQLSDCVWLLAAAIALSLRKLGVDERLQKTALQIAVDFSELTEPLTKRFEESQRDFYGRSTEGS